MAGRQAAAKDPERVRLGRLGALVVHSRGRTNTAPARAAWEAKLASEVDHDGTLEPGERARRMEYALRARMTRLAMHRWDTKTRTPVSETTGSPRRTGDARADRQPL